MLMPKRTKFRKMMKGRNRGQATRGTKLSYGSIGLQAVEAGRLTSRQIEATRRAITREIKRRGKIWICVFPDKPVTKRPAEVRMGGGKGGLDHWAAQIKPGRVLFEMEGVEEEVAMEAFRLAAYKLPLRTTIIKRGA